MRTPEEIAAACERIESATAPCTPTLEAQALAADARELAATVERLENEDATRTALAIAESVAQHGGSPGLVGVPLLFAVQSALDAAARAESAEHDRDEAERAAQAAHVERDRLREALEEAIGALRVIHTAARDDEKGQHLAARAWLDERGIYNGDVTGGDGDAVILLVAQAALTPNADACDPPPSPIQKSALLATLSAVRTEGAPHPQCAVAGCYLTEPHIHAASSTTVQIPPPRPEAGLRCVTPVSVVPSGPDAEGTVRT